MDPRDVRDLWRVVLKCCWSEALGSKGSSLGVPEVDTSRSIPDSSNTSRSPLFIEEQVRFFLWMVGDYQACKTESEEHGHAIFEAIVQVCGRSLAWAIIVWLTDDFFCIIPNNMVLQLSRHLYFFMMSTEVAEARMTWWKGRSLMPRGSLARLRLVPPKQRENLENRKNAQTIFRRISFIR